MKHCCRNCHFLAREDVIERAGRFTNTWTKEEREKGQMATLPGLARASKCARGVWDTGVDPELKSKLDEILDQNRKGECFFIEHAEGMLFDAAKELHRIKYENQHLKKSYQFALWGLIIAGVGLVIGAFFQAANFFFR